MYKTSKYSPIWPRGTLMWDLYFRQHSRMLQKTGNLSAWSAEKLLNLSIIWKNTHEYIVVSTYFGRSGFMLTFMLEGGLGISPPRGQGSCCKPLRKALTHCSVQAFHFQAGSPLCTCAPHTYFTEWLFLLSLASCWIGSYFPLTYGLRTVPVLDLGRPGHFKFGSSSK